MGYTTNSVTQLQAYSLQLQMALAAEPFSSGWLINHYQSFKGMSKEDATFSVIAMTATDKLI